MTITPRPQATRLTFALLAIVMIGFGVFAERHMDVSETLLINAQTTTSTSANQGN